MCPLFDLKSEKSIENMQKGNKLWNVKSKQPETKAFKGTCYIKKKSCTDEVDEGNPTKKNGVTSHLK